MNHLCLKLLILLIFSLFYNHNAIADNYINKEKKSNEIVDSGVIFTSEKTAENSRYIGGEVYYWTPISSDILSLEGDLYRYLKKSRNRNVVDILNNLSTYKRQYLGYVKNNNKMILINGFCKDYWKEDSSWKYEFVRVLDGGSCFFRIRYNVKEKFFEGLEINGEA